MKAIDLQLAMYIAMHSAIRSIDHLSEILKAVGKGSNLERLKIHRTKCSKLITNVIAPAMLTDLVSDIGAEGYSLIIDESTDVSIMKYLAILVRYHSRSKEEIATEFLGLLEVYRATADALHTSVKEYLTTIGLNYLNLIGIGSDGGLNLCGPYNSVYAYFKAEVRVVFQDTRFPI